MANNCEKCNILAIFIDIGDVFRGILTIFAVTYNRSIYPLMTSFIIQHKKTIFAIALFFPLLLNLLLAIPTPTCLPVIGNAPDWLLFWATYITALASFAMVIAAYETLTENRKQWEFAHSAHIGLTAYQDKFHQVFVRICNTSSVGVIIQSIQVCPEPSQAVKNLFCIVKSHGTSDNFTKWQHLYKDSYVVIRPYEIEDILLLQNFPRKIQEELTLIIRYNNTSTEAKIDLNDIRIIQNDYYNNK